MGDRVVLWRLSVAFGLFACALCAIGVYRAYRAAPVGAGLVVLATDRDLGDRAVGRSTLVFRITNQSDQPGRVIGLEEG